MTNNFLKNFKIYSFRLGPASVSRLSLLFSGLGFGPEKVTNMNCAHHHHIYRGGNPMPEVTGYLDDVEQLDVDTIQVTPSSSISASEIYSFFISERYIFASQTNIFSHGHNSE